MPHNATSNRTGMKHLSRTFIFLAAVAAVWAQPRKTIFLITDGEGVAGICRQDQTDSKDPELRALLTGEVNAAVDGFYAGGADEVIVWDGHDGSQTLSALTIHPRAKLIIGKLGVAMSFERRYAAIAFLGQHAHANSRGGIMAHSYNSLGIQNMLLNGHPTGEIETNAALAGVFGTPVIFLSGDQAAANELHAIVPEAELAVVKEGFSNYTCQTLSAQAARDLIRERAAQSVKKIGIIKPFRIEGPVTLQIEYTTRNALDVDASLRPGSEMIDARTVLYRGKDFLEAWTLGRSR
jgi:D-amino peptidase